jgi:hypothetical protein
VAGIGLLDRVDRESPNRVDAELIETFGDRAQEILPAAGTGPPAFGRVRALDGAVANPFPFFISRTPGDIKPK